MKQYVYRIFLMLGLALWLVSCTGTETPIDDLGNIPEESIPSGTGNMFSLAMRIPLPNDYMGTKAYEGVDRGIYRCSPITMILKLPEVISIIGPLMGTESSFRQ